ncbi:hypothetical protein [Dyella subtropica]|uniref:hypothetical protein n=1 Tax=Dyella subtropica TaxID=2992127 RepID=UPI0022566468|nr:hypothetical protein [Dyella subtropica]
MLHDTAFLMDRDDVHVEHDELLREAARALLMRGNVLQLNDHGALALHAGVGQRHAAALPCVCLDSAQGRLLVALEREPNASPLGDAHWQDYVGEARLLAWSLAHEPLLDALGKIFGGGFMATQTLPAGTSAGVLWLALNWHDGNDQSLQGWLGLGSAEVRLLTACAEWKRDASRLAMLGDATALTFDLVLPGRVLDPVTASDLTPGDVLLIGREADCDARLLPDRDTSRSMFGLPDGWAVQRRQGQWAIAAKPLLSTPMLSTPADPNIPSRPQFHLTRLTLSPDEVSTLQPGTVLHYDAQLLGSTVGISLDGHRFGVGVVLALGEWLGVRMTQKDLTYKGGTRGFQ